MLKKSHNFATIIIIIIIIIIITIIIITSSSSSSVSSSSRCPLTTYVPFVSPLRSPSLEHDHLPHPYLFSPSCLSLCSPALQNADLHSQS